MRISDAVRMSVYFQEMKNQRLTDKLGYVPVKAYTFIDDWRSRMPTDLDKAMSRTFRL